MARRAEAASLLESLEGQGQLSQDLLDVATGTVDDDDVEPDDEVEEEPDASQPDASEEAGEGDEESDENLTDEEVAERQARDELARARREGARSAKRMLRADLRRALNGDEKARNALSSSDRGFLQLFEESVEQAKQQAMLDAQAKAQQDSQEQSFSLHDQYLHMMLTDQREFDARMQNPSIRAWWQGFETLKNHHGLPIYARADEIKLKMGLNNPRQEQKTAAQTPASSDPESLYTELQLDDDAKYLSEEDWSKLDPDNFLDDKGVQLPNTSHRMTRLFGELVATRKRRLGGKAAQQQPTNAGGSGRQRMPIPSSGGRVPSRITEETIIDRFLADRAAGKRTEGLTDAMRKRLEAHGVKI